MEIFEVMTWMEVSNISEKQWVGIRKLVSFNTIHLAEWSLLNMEGQGSLKKTLLAGLKTMRRADASDAVWRETGQLVIMVSRGRMEDKEMKRKNWCPTHIGGTLRKKIDSIVLESKWFFFSLLFIGWFALVFETWSHVAHSSFKLTMYWSWHWTLTFYLQSCDYRCVPPCTTFKVVLNKFWNSDSVACHTDGVRQGMSHPEAEKKKKQTLQNQHVCLQDIHGSWLSGQARVTASKPKIPLLPLLSKCLKSSNVVCQVSNENSRDVSKQCVFRG